jgi:hypothetical protein
VAQLLRIGDGADGLDQSVGDVECHDQDGPPIVAEEQRPGLAVDLAQHIRTSAEGMGGRVVVVDSTESLERAAGIVERHFDLSTTQARSALCGGGEAEALSEHSSVYARPIRTAVTRRVAGWLYQDFNLDLILIRVLHRACFCRIAPRPGGMMNRWKPLRTARLRWHVDQT